MSKKALNGLLIAFIGSLAIYAVIKYDMLNFSLLKLLSFGAEETNKSIEHMCSKSSQDLVDFYRNQGPDYKFTIEEEGDDSFVEISKKVYNGEQVEWFSSIKNFFSSNGSLIFLLILLNALVILWIPYMCCVCCKNCLCCPDVLKLKYKLFTIICIVLCLIILIICFIGYTENSSIVHGIFGFGCSLLKLTYHVINGDDYKVKPYWSGVESIISKFNMTRENITKLAKLVNDIDTNVQNIKVIISDFSEEINDDYEDKKDHKIPNPEPDEDEITPDYINLYGPPDTNATTLGVINEELIIYDALIVKVFGEIIDTINLSPDTLQALDNGLDTVVKGLGNSLKTLDSKVGVVIDNIDESLDYIDNAGRAAMNVLFTINIVLVIAITVSLALILFFKKGHCLLCTSWCLLYNFMIATLGIAILFLLIGIFLQNVSVGVLGFLENIKKDDSSTVADVLDCCFNGDGLLYKRNSIFPKDFNIAIIEKIYDIESALSDQIEAIKKMNSQSIILANNQYQDFKNNATAYIESLKNALENVHKYIDVDATDSKVDPSTSIKDIWVLNKNDCKDYNYISPDKTNLLTATVKECLVITEWTPNEIENRYKGTESTEGTTISDLTKNYCKSIVDCVNGHNEFVDGLIEDNGKYNSSFGEIKDNSIQILDHVINFIRPLREDFNQIVGGGSIFEIVNCNFMKRDFNKLFEVIYTEFGSSFKSTATILLVICIFQVLMTLVILIVVDGLKSKDNQGNVYTQESGGQQKLLDISPQPLTGD